MENVLKRIKVLRQVGVAGKVFKPGEYDVGPGISKEGAVALIRMGKAEPVDVPEPETPEPAKEPEKAEPEKPKKQKRKYTRKVKNADDSD